MEKAASMLDNLILWGFNVLIFALVGFLLWLATGPMVWWATGQWEALGLFGLLLAYGWLNHVTWLYVRRLTYSGKHHRQTPSSARRAPENRWGYLRPAQSSLSARSGRCSLIHCRTADRLHTLP